MFAAARQVRHSLVRHSRRRFSSNMPSRIGQPLPRDHSRAVLTRHRESSVVVSRERRHRPNLTGLSICDIQEKFRTAIWEYPKVISTAQKMVKAAKILNMPIYTTTQNSARLGATVSELQDHIDQSEDRTTIDKTAFSMLVPELSAALVKQSSSSPSDTGKPHKPISVILVGIETHICVTQTALDLLSMGHKVYILADGVSSCNAGERPIALARLAREGAVVTSSESVLFELLGDAGSKDFKMISGLVKETKEDTKSAVDTFCKL